MKWKATPTPKHRDLRTVVRFLWWPRCFDGEWRWLERARIRQVFIECIDPYDFTWGWSSFGWAENHEQRD